MSRLRKQRQHKRLRSTLDRLSTLPDAIICDILSRLPINDVVSTSVLSHRWRHLWRGVNQIRFVYDYNVVKRASKVRYVSYDTRINDIVQNLSCKKLQLFHLDMSLVPHGIRPKSDVQVESVFRQVYDRNVEELMYTNRFSRLNLPAFLLHSASLVSLKLCGEFTIKLPENNNASVSLPNLKHLVLRTLLNLPTWLESLFRSSPLLESFVLWTHDTSHDFPDSLTLFGPSLTSLEINIDTYNMKLNHTNFFIHAPKLSNIDITDNANFYYFVNDHCPTALRSARLDLTRMELVARGYRISPSDLVICEGYFHRMSMFVQGMSAVRYLELHVDASSNVFPTLYSANITDGLCPIFRNITRFKTSLGGIGLNGWSHLLPLLHFFPYLNHLDVVMSDIPLEEEQDFCPPDSVPNCLVSHLKTINISALFYSVECDLNSLATYILSHALVLEELHFSVYFGYHMPNESLLLKQHDLCRSLFKLPKCSTCEVVFSGPDITASSNTYTCGIPEVYNGLTSAH